MLVICDPRPLVTCPDRAGAGYPLRVDTPRLTIEELEGDQCTLRLKGEVDAHSSVDLARKIASVGEAALLRLDLSGVDFIDSSGLRVLLTAHRDFEQRGARVEVHKPSDAVRRLLELTALDDHLHIH